MSAAYSAVFVPLVVGLSLYALPSELRAQQRAPVPDASAQDTSRKAATEIYGGRFRQVKTTAEKIALAAEMIEAAAKVEKGSADQYVLLKIASDVSSGAGDAPTALQAIEKLAECFDVPTAKLIGETLSTAARNASTSNQQKTLGEAVLGMADAIADEEEFELVLSLCEAARSSAQKARQYALAKDLTAKIEEIKKRQSAAQEYRAAWAVLDKNPTDPAANLAAGRYECFVMGKWDTGVAKLALGSDAALKEVAIKDLRGADSADEQTAIGDAWWTLAETKQGSERDMMRLRAGFWYRLAAPNVAQGLVRLKISQRLAEVSKLGLPSVANTAKDTMQRPPTGPAVPTVSQAATAGQAPAPAIAPFDERAAKQYQMLWSKHLKVAVVQTNSIGMRLALIPPGEFEMGSSQEEVARLLEEAKQKDVPRWYIERTPAEAPKHPVKITRPFYLGICEVTQEQYQRLMGSNPSKFSGVPVRPVEQVTWTDAAEFCRRLNEAPQEKSAGAVYRLPTESEWEYACRAGTTTCYSFGDDFAGHVRDVWWQGSQTQFVGQLRPNAWGLLDMHGNVWEWCQDCYDERYYQQLVGNIANDPQGPSSGSFRLFRGGGWGDWAGICRSAFRNRAPPDFQNSGIGFRVVRIVAP